MIEVHCMHVWKHNNKPYNMHNKKEIKLPRFHLTPVRLFIIKKIENNKYW
jgi:hypothetical protein